MRVEATLLSALLISSASNALAAGEDSLERCRTPPKLIVPEANREHPPSTAAPPVGTVVLEFTVATDGTILDVLLVEQVDTKLARWAIKEANNLRFEPVSRACRTRFTLTSRIADA